MGMFWFFFGEVGLKKINLNLNIDSELGRKGEPDSSFWYPGRGANSELATTYMRYMVCVCVLHF